MKEHAPAVQAWITTFAIIVGGIWAYERFSNQDVEALNPNLAVSTEVEKYNDKLRLLVVHVKPTNSGKVLVTVCRHGLSLSLKKIPPQDKAGFIDIGKIPVLYRLTDLAETSGFVADVVPYEIEPGVTYDEVRIFTVSPGDTYIINAEMDYDNCESQEDSEEIDATTTVQVE